MSPAGLVDCNAGWAGTWQFSPARPFFTGNVTVTQSDCQVTAYWWEHVTDWSCRGQWLTGWIQTKRDYTAHGLEISPLSSQSDECSGAQGWRPSNMILSADATQANSDSEVWTKAPPAPAPPNPPLPSCLPLGECAIGFLEGFGPQCCDGLVLQQDYSDACHHSAGKYGYPEGGLSCQETTCLAMGADCYGNSDGCCPGLSCHNMGISGMMCA